MNIGDRGGEGERERIGYGTDERNEGEVEAGERESGVGIGNDQRKRK